jgi:hypothetical protein
VLSQQQAKEKADITLKVFPHVMIGLCLCVVVLVRPAIAACAAPSLVTLFAQNNGVTANYSIVFDVRVDVTGGLWINAIDLNVQATVGAALTTIVYIRNGQQNFLLFPAYCVV